MSRCGWHAWCGRDRGHPGDCEIRPEPGFQENLLQLGTYGAIAGGAAGGGKSAALLLEALRHVDQPGYTALLLRKEQRDLVRPGGLWAKSLQLYPAFGGEAQAAEYLWTFPSGATIQFGYVDTRNYERDYQGTEIAFLAFDELTHFSRSEFVYLLGRNRSSCGVTPYWRATCNPDPDSWVRELVDWWIADAEYQGEVLGYPELTGGLAGWPRRDRAGAVRYYLRRDGVEHWAESRAELAQRFGVAPERVRSFTFLPSSEIIRHLGGSYAGSIDEQETHLRLRLLGNWNARRADGRPFSPEWLTTPGGAPLPELLLDEEPEGVEWLRVWDLAATAEGDARTTGSETAGLKLGLQGDLLVVAHALIERGDEATVEGWVLGCAGHAQGTRGGPVPLVADGKDCRVWLCRERAGAGKAQLGHYQRLLRGWEVDGEPETGAKRTRLGPAVVVAKTRRLRLVRGPWNARFLQRLLLLPGPPDDVGDALAAGLDQLAEQAGVPTVQSSQEAIHTALDAFERHRQDPEAWPL